MSNAVNIAQGGSNNVTFRNKIINGAMVIDQRNAGASVTPANGAYTLDRWKCYQTTASKFSVQQNAGSVTPPVGFTNYLGATSLSAYSVSASDYYTVQQAIEAYNTADLGWGTANAKTVTLSFWVRSSLTGTFGGAIFNAAGDRSYPFTYTISSASTWEQKSVTVAGDTSGSWGTTNGISLQICFSLGAGSTYSGTAGAWAGTLYASATGATSVVGTNNATFYITGVQLEAGTTASPFEYRQYGTEFNLCQRYCQTRIGTEGSNGATVQLGYGNARSGTQVFWQDRLQVKMRVAPSLTVVNAATGGFYVYSTGASTANSVVYDVSDPNTMLGYFGGLTVTAPNFYSAGISVPSTGQVIYSAEL